MCRVRAVLLAAMAGSVSILGLRQAAAAPAAAETSNSPLQEIIVTAQKRTEDLQKVSLAMNDCRRSFLPTQRQCSAPYL